MRTLALLSCGLAAVEATAGVWRDMAPDTMECLALCSAWSSTAPGGGGGVAKLYSGIGATWGFLELDLPDENFFPTNVGIEAHLHVPKCSPDWTNVPAEQDIFLSNGEKFRWWLPGYGNTTRLLSSVHELQVPWPEHGAKSVVVHDASGARSMCCNLTKCVPPLEYTCKAACTSWKLVDDAWATAVRGQSELWGNELDSWMFIDLVFDPLNRTDAVWKASLEGVLMCFAHPRFGRCQQRSHTDAAPAGLQLSLIDGPPEDFEERRSPHALLVHDLLGSGSFGHMRVEAHHLRNLALPNPDRARTLVVRYKDRPLATCQVEACSERQVPPPQGEFDNAGVWVSIVVPVIAAALVIMIVAGALFYAFVWRPKATGRHLQSRLCLPCFQYRNKDELTAAQLGVVTTQDDPPPCPATPQQGLEGQREQPVPAEPDNPLLAESRNAVYSRDTLALPSRRPDDSQEDVRFRQQPAGLNSFDEEASSMVRDENVPQNAEPTGSAKFDPQLQLPEAEGLHLKCVGHRSVRLPQPAQTDETLPFLAKQAYMAASTAPTSPDDSCVPAGPGNALFQHSRSAGSMSVPVGQPNPKAVDLFERCMHHVNRSRRCLCLPQHADPVAQELSQLMSHREREGDKYKEPTHVEGSLYAWNAAAKLQRITFRTQQLLLLLVASGAPRNVLEQCETELKGLAEAGQSSSIVTPHLNLLRSFFAVMKEQPSAADVYHLLRELLCSTVQLKDPEIQDLQNAYCEIQRKEWSSPVTERVRDMIASVRDLSDHAEMLRQQVDDIAVFVRMDAADIVQVLEQIEGKNDELGKLARRLLHTPVPADFHAFLPACKRAALHGRVMMSFCFAANKPFSRTGGRIPIKLPCGCTATFEIAQALQSSHACCVCHQPLSQSFSVEVDVALQRIVQLRAYDLQMPSFPRNSINLGRKLGQGAQAIVHAATLTSDHHKENVAVKMLQLVPRVSERKPHKTADLHHSITTMFVASGNPHVCKMHGASWSDDSLWLVMEECESSLKQFVEQVGVHRHYAGLPPIDVLVLGWMLLDALGTIHDYAKSLHLDIKPDNVMLAPKKPDQDELSRRSIKLIDFGLGVALATRTSSSCPSSNAENARGWTQGFAPPEQMHLNQAKPASDVYAVGATMLFAATGLRPYGNDTTLAGVIGNFLNKIQMPVAGYLPEGLQTLIRDMTQLVPRTRPTRLDAQRRILQLYLQLERQGETAEYLEPHWGMPTMVPAEHC